MIKNLEERTFLKNLLGFLVSIKNYFIETKIYRIESIQKHNETRLIKLASFFYTQSILLGYI